MPSHLPRLQASISLFPTVIFRWLPFVLFLFFQSIMEPQQQLPNQQPPNEDNTSSGGAKGSFLCRQSSTRWTPTTDQIRILKDIYYNTGLRSPNAEQIQRISARLRQYGKIEGKNVFYWFQNHKARERQKKKFANDGPSMQQRAVSNAASWRPEDYSIHNQYPSLTPGTSSGSPSSASVFATVGQMGNYGYGSVTMEKCFRKCSISAGASSNGAGGRSISHERVGVDPCGSSYNLWNKQIILTKETPEEGDPEKLEEGEADAEIETLPLFPLHCENNINAFCDIKPTTNNSCNYKNWHGSNDGHTSLELSLNSYPGQSPDHV